MWRTQRTGGWRCETRPQGSSAGTRAEAERRAQGDRGGCQAGALRAVIQRGQVVRSGKQREKWESHRVWPSLKESTRRHQMCRWQVKTATGTAGKAGERWQQVSAHGAQQSCGNLQQVQDAKHKHTSHVPVCTAGSRAWGRLPVKQPTSIRPMTWPGKTAAEQNSTQAPSHLLHLTMITNEPSISSRRERKAWCCCSGVSGSTYAPPVTAAREQGQQRVGVCRRGWDCMSDKPSADTARSGGAVGLPH